MIRHYCLVSEDRTKVTGAQLNFDLASLKEFAKWMQDDPRIKDFDNLSLPCEVRAQLEAILEAEKDLRQKVK